MRSEQRCQGQRINQEFHTAIGYYGQALPLIQVVDNRSWEKTVWAKQGGAALAVGQLAVAQTSYQRALALLQDSEDQQTETVLRSNLAVIAWKQRKPRECIAEAMQALTLSRANQDRSGEAFALEVLGRAYSTQNNVIQAQRFLEQALDLARTLEERGRESSALDGLATLHAMQGRASEAQTIWIEALSIAQDVGEPGEIADIQWAYGQFLICQGERERGIALLQDCAAYQQRIGHTAAAEHAALAARLQAGGGLPGPCL